MKPKKVYILHLHNCGKRDFQKNGQLVFKARLLLRGNFTVLTLKVTPPNIFQDPGTSVACIYELFYIFNVHCV